MLNSLNFYIEKYEILTNNLLVKAGFLSPKHRAFNNSTLDEKENFIKISKDNLIEEI